MNWPLLYNSLLVAGVTTALAVALGFLAALFMAGLERSWRLFFLSVAVAAFSLPPFLVTNCWMRLVGLTGIWRHWLPVDLYSMGGTILILTSMLWPVSAMLTLASWSRLEPAQFESEPALTGIGLVRWLLLPSARNGVVQSAVLTFVLALNNFAVPSLLQVKVFTAEVFVYFNTKFDPPGAAAMSWPLIVAPLLLLLILKQDNIAWPRIEGPVSATTFRRRSGPALHWSSGTVSVALTVVSLALPLADLIADGKTWIEIGPALKAGQTAIVNSGILAAVTAVVVGGVALATWRWRIGAWLWVPYLVPGVLLAIALVYLMNRPFLDWLYRGVGIVVLAWTIRYAAPGWNVIARAMRSRDRDLSDAARLEGASAWQTFWQANWPQMRPQILTAGYVTYLLCLWDVETLAIMQPPGGETLASRIFGFLHYGHNAQVNALCLVLLALALAPLLAFVAAPLTKLVPLFAPRRMAPNTARWLVLIAISFCLAATGCKPRGSNDAAVDSMLFSAVQIIGSRGGGLGQFNKPRSVAVDTNDNLYVVDMTGRVQKFSPEGSFLSYWQMPETDKGKPKGMCRDQNGNIVVLEPHYSRVNHYRPDGTLLAQWGAHGTNDNKLAFPRAVAVNSHGDVFTSEYGLTERVQEFSANGKEWIRTIGHAGGGNGEFNRPEGLGIDAQDRVYVADSCNHRIQVFLSTGEFVRVYGRPGTGRGEMSYPYDIRVDPAGLQYVCEFGNSRIQVFDANDRAVELLGGPGSDPGQFNNPWGLALDSKGNLYVADSMNHRVQKFIRRESGRAQYIPAVSGQWSVVSGWQRTTDDGQQ